MRKSLGISVPLALTGHEVLTALNNPSQSNISTPCLGGQCQGFQSYVAFCGTPYCPHDCQKQPKNSSLFVISRKYDKLYLKHCQNGNGFYFKTDKDSKSLNRFRNQARGFNRLAQKLDLDVYFMTFTLKDSELTVAENTLKKLLDFMRVRFKRQGLPFYYVWAVELQKRRLAVYGTKALHWHIAVSAPPGTLPDVDSVNGRLRLVTDGSVVSNKDLVGAWGRGRVQSKLAWANTFDYLSKYLNKDYASLESYNSAWAKLRRFGSSQFGYYSYPNWAFKALNDYFHDQDLNSNSLNVEKRGSKVILSAIDSEWSELNDIWKGIDVGYKIATNQPKKVPIYSFRSPYIIIWEKSVPSAPAERPVSDGVGSLGLPDG